MLFFFWSMYMLDILDVRCGDQFFFQVIKEIVFKVQKKIVENWIENFIDNFLDCEFLKAEFFGIFKALKFFKNKKESTYRVKFITPFIKAFYLFKYFSHCPKTQIFFLCFITFFIFLSYFSFSSKTSFCFQNHKNIL